MFVDAFVPYWMALGAIVLLTAALRLAGRRALKPGSAARAEARSRTLEPADRRLAGQRA